MKKIFIALSMMVIPLTAHAQSDGEQVVQDAANDLKPAFCENSIPNAIKIVENCYANVDADSAHEKMNQCIIEDMTVVFTIKQKQQQYLNNYQTDPYSNLDFMQKQNIMMRQLKHPSFFNSMTETGNTPQAVGEIVMKAYVKIIERLKQEGCVDLDKLK